MKFRNLNSKTGAFFSTRVLSEAQRYSYIDQPVSNRIADLRRISAAGEGNRLAEEWRAKNIDRWGKVGVVERIEY